MMLLSQLLSRSPLAWVVSHVRFSAWTLEPLTQAPVTTPDLSTLPEVSLDLHMPDCVSFVLYLCGGEAVGAGSLAGYLRDAGTHTVTVDVKLGGYAHDMTV
eukprot:1009514-Prymnesium_polylepis.1